jgi:hypothetical protein
MRLYEVIETDEGLAVAEVEPGITPEDAAARQGGLLVDPGLYKSYEDAYDAMLAIQKEDDEDAGAPP